MGATENFQRYNPRWFMILFMVYLTMNLTCIMLKISYDILNLFLAYLPKAMISDNPYRTEIATSLVTNDWL